MAKFSKMSFRKKRSNKMNKRIKKLENQIIPVLKTFEQRQYDFIAPAAPTYDGTPLIYGTPVVWRGSDLYPTLQVEANVQPTGSYQTGTVRLGDKITLKSLRLQGEVRACVSNAASAERTNLVRLILVKFPDSVRPLTNAEIVSSVLQQYPTSTGTSINSVMACYSNYKNVVTPNNSIAINKYQILHDQTFRLQNPLVQNAGAEPWRRAFKIDKFFKKGLVMQYAKNTLDQPDINQICMICLSDSTVAPHPDMTLVSRAKYMDA